MGKSTTVKAPKAAKVEKVDSGKKSKSSSSKKAAPVVESPAKVGKSTKKGPSPLSKEVSSDSDDSSSEDDKPVAKKNGKVAPAAAPVAAKKAESSDDSSDDSSDEEVAAVRVPSLAPPSPVPRAYLEESFVRLFSFRSAVLFGRARQRRGATQLTLCIPFSLVQPVVAPKKAAKVAKKVVEAVKPVESSSDSSDSESEAEAVRPTSLVPFPSSTYASAVSSARNLENRWRELTFSLFSLPSPLPGPRRGQGCQGCQGRRRCRQGRRHRRVLRRLFGRLLGRGGAQLSPLLPPPQLTLLLPQAPKGKPAAAAAAAESSDSDDSSSEEEAAAAPASKKRAAEDTEAPSKKAKTDDAPAAAAPVDETTAEVTTVYVGGLSWNVDNEWLKSELEVCGEVVSARVVTDRETQKSRGFGYVVRSLFLLWKRRRRKLTRAFLVCVGVRQGRVCPEGPRHGR